MLILVDKYFNEYQKQTGSTLADLIRDYDFSDRHIEFGYSTQASAVYSSNIEGNIVDLNSYMNYRLAKKQFKPTKEIEEIDNLVAAYQFAQQHQLNEINFLQCHKIFSKTLLIKSKRGKYRNEKVAVYNESGLVYLAIEPEFVHKKMAELFEDIDTLLELELSVKQVFYYSSLVHLIFVHIHPFRDGNGRGARLLEKWFMSKKLGEKFWKIPSEKYYWDNRAAYYNCINLGVNYYELDYDLCLPFLLMLSNCLK